MNATEFCRGEQSVDALLGGETGSRVLPVLGGPAVITAFADGLTGRLAARLLGMRPGTSTLGALTIEHIPTTTPQHITAVETESGDRADVELWHRDLGGRSWTSVITTDTATREHTDAITERVGPLTLRFDLELDNAWATHMTMRTIHLGPFRLPTGRHWGVAGRVAADASTDVTVRVPGGRCGYHVDFRSAP